MDRLGVSKEINNGTSNASMSQLWQWSCCLEFCMRNDCWFISQGSSKIESANNKNFLTALHFLQQSRKRQHFRPTVHFFLEFLCILKPSLYHVYQTIFPQSTDVWLQSNQIRMVMSIHNSVTFINISVLKSKKTCWNDRHTYTSKVKMYFYKTPIFLFASQ